MQLSDGRRRWVGVPLFTSHHHRRRLNILYPLLLPLLLTLVSGETTSTVLYPNPAVTPNFSQHPIISIIFIIFIPFFPCSITGLILLWKRRKHFPIAGRGSPYLLWLGCNILVYTSIASIVGVAYPNGFPCGIEFFLHYCISIPTGVIYMLRGWTLVFRLEIKNYLTELRWRQEKKKMLKEYEEQQQQQAGHIEIAVADEDHATIPGYFFIHHRQWIESKFLFPIVGGLFVVVAIVAILVGVFDPDIQLTNAYLHEQGTLPDGVDYTESQFLPSTFLSSPACLAYGIKTVLFIGTLSSFMMPFLIWCTWRIHLDKKKQVTRQKDQAHCHKLVHGKEAETIKTEKERLGLSLNDSQNVKDELGILVVVVFSDCLLKFLLQAYSPGYAVLSLLPIYVFLFCISIATPLYLSYSVSRKHRQLIDGSKSACDVNASKNGIYNRLPHQRPYFTLKYILHQSHTYDVLLSFLQKEYSSENALFWSEARSFEKAAKELESKIPTWPSSMDPDGEGTQGTGMSGDVLASRTSATGQGRLVHNLSQRVSHPSSAGGRPPLLQQPSTMMDTSIQSHQLRRLSSEIELPAAAVGLPQDSAGSMVRGLSTTIVAYPSSTLRLSPPPPNEHVLQTQGSFKSMNVDTINEASGLNHTLSTAASISVIKATKLNFVEFHAEAERLKSWAQQIYNEFIKRSSVMEINISEDLNKLVQSQLAQLSSWSPTPLTQVTGDPDYSSYPLPPPFPLSTLYRQARLAVFDLIQRDSFRRFILTPAFQQLLHQADEDELARFEKQQDLVADTANVVEKALEELRPKLDDQATNSKSRPLRTNVSVAGSQQHISTGGDFRADSLQPTNGAVSRLHHDQSFLLSDPTTPQPNDDGDLLQLPGQPQPLLSSPSTRMETRIDSTKIRTITIDEREDEEEEELPPFEQRLSPQPRTSLSPSPSSPPSLLHQKSYPSRAHVYQPGVTNSDGDCVDLIPSPSFTHSS